MTTRGMSYSRANVSRVPTCPDVSGTRESVNVSRVPPLKGDTDTDTLGHEKGVTHDEETMLKGYLRLDAHAFEEWLRTIRDGRDDGELKYKATLAEAVAYRRGYEDGAKACAAWVEAQEDSALAPTYRV